MTYQQALDKMEFLHNGEVIDSSIWVNRLGQVWFNNHILENDFQNYLLEQYDIVVIENIEFSPSSILKHLAKNIYDQAHFEYCINEALDIVNDLELFDKFIKGDRFIARIKEEK
jgi:hypothetical protein